MYVLCFKVEKYYVQPDQRAERGHKCISLIDNNMKIYEYSINGGKKKAKALTWHSGIKTIF